MTDIAERLQTYARFCLLDAQTASAAQRAALEADAARALEAAKEIERLRAQCGIAMIDGYNKGKAECNRLRAEVAEMRERIKTMRVAAMFDDWETFDADYRAALSKEEL